MKSDYITLEERGDVAILWLAQRDAAVNKLSPPWLEALDEVLAFVRERSSLRAAVLISAKPDSFVVGADLEVLRGLDSPGDAQALSHRAHELLAGVRDLGKPTIAALHGATMGGGLELALACTYRLASDAPATRLACPEVRLGLIPGAGATQTLPRLIGVPRALDLLLSGRSVTAATAYRWGLVDALHHRPGLLAAALQAARRLADGALEPDRHREPLRDRLLDSNPLSRQLVYRRAEQRMLAKTRGNYSAPPRILECVQVGLEKGMQQGLDCEARRFAQSVFDPQCHALVGLFFAKQRAEKNPYPAAAPVRRLGVLGAGQMGAGIAAVSAGAGLEVRICDRDLETATQAKRSVWQQASRRVARGSVTAFERDVQVERVAPLADPRQLGPVDLVIEAVPEDPDLKRSLLAEVEATLPDHAILASNTSSLPIAGLAAACARPERLLGIHYFSPVGKVPLVELVRTEQTAEEVLSTAYDLALTQGKTPIVVRDGPGFYTTRVLALYLNEALLALEEGAEIPSVDAAARDAGFAMGPFEVLDQVGLDVAAKVTAVLAPLFAPRGIPMSGLASALADRGHLGAKSGSGFYRYGEARRGRGKRSPNPRVADLLDRTAGEAPHPAQLQERLLLMFVNESVRCLDEGVLATAADGDLGAVLGLGFPPFLGGPFHYVVQRTPYKVRTELELLAERHGSRFTPSASLARAVQAGATAP